MVTSSIIKHLLSDDLSLSDYQRGSIVSFDDVKRRLLLLERQGKSCIPDHYYRLNQEKSFDKMESLGEIIRKGLYRLADEYLELRGYRIHVKQLKQNDWQELICHIPPLLLQMAFLHRNKPIVDRSPTSMVDYFNKYIQPNVKYTALPYPYIPQLENYIKEKQGLHDLHIHLNGSTETDQLWQDFLFDPDKVCEELKKGLKEKKVREQFEQELCANTPVEFRNLFYSARSIRFYLFNMCFRLKEDCKDKKERKDKEVEEILRDVLDAAEPTTDKENPFADDSAYNPFADLVTEEYKNPRYPMAVEGLMYVLVFDDIVHNARESVASLFHFYLLILGLTNRLLVQQADQFGFEQFQKITLNELRSNSERAYKNRFFQLHGNEQRNIRFLEGRFSPKGTRDENVKLIRDINKGWESMLRDIQKELDFSQENLSSSEKNEEFLSKKDLPQLKLIAHFIKQTDDKSSSEIRYRKLRSELRTKACVLALLKKNDPETVKDLIAIDAASSEFDTPPEVFASSFRYLRRNGFKHFTYHAGEDFFHIISGLRAIYEAIDFNDLQCGDRIGHATAAGVSPEVWINNIGSEIFIRQGQYLDDLLFTYHLIISRSCESLKAILPLLIHKIQELSFSIYKKSYSLKALEDSWLMRRFCPVLLFSSSEENAKMHDVFDSEEWSDINKEIVGFEKDERIELLQKYHCADYHKEYDKIIEIQIEEFFNKTDLELLQLEVLKIMHKKEIVIETLPTSNVRIGLHHNFDSYHLWNWVKWEKEGKAIPPIVVGTDDTGIFATNIYNEYANIYCNLIQNKDVTHNEAMNLIRKMDNNGRIYRFE